MSLLACVIVEAELDATLVFQEAGDLVGVLALGSASTKPDKWSHQALKKSGCILVALDNDQAGYKAWNPVLVPIEGELREGEKIKYQMTQPDGKQSDVMARVKKMVELKELNQGGGIPGILTFDHKWQLERVDGGTRVIQHEEYRGIGVWFWDESWVEPAYARANEALRKRVLQLREN